MATGLTGAPVHSGSWFGLPDFGISEIFQGKLTTSPSPTGLTTNTGAPAPAVQGTPIQYGSTVLGANTDIAPPPALPDGGGNPVNNNIVGGDPVGGDTGGGEDLNAQLDAIFNPQLATLNNQVGGVTDAYNTTVGGINDQYDLSNSSINDANADASASLVSSGNEAGTRKEDALTSATRLYDELQRGGQQRFGGASSAGEAYQTLTAVEQQRKQGTIQTQFETAMQKVGELKANLKSKFMLAIKELEVQKNEALGQAKLSFDDGIRQIQAAKNQIASDRATASLNLLQDLRNKVYQINLQSLQFKQQLATNNEISNGTVDKYTQTWLQQQQQAMNDVSQFGTLAMNEAGKTRLGIGAGQVQAPQNYVGQITPQKKDELYA